MTKRKTAALDLPDEAAIEALSKHFDAVFAESESGRGSFAEQELATLTVGNELIRRRLQNLLQARVAEHGEDDLLIDSERYRRHAEGSASYHSLVGPLEVERPTYRKRGEHNGPIVVPLELDAGIIERATPALAERVAHGHGEGGSRALEAQLWRSGRRPPSRATLETLSKRIGTAVSADRRAVVAVARRRESLPEGTVILQLGLDRTSVPMEEDAPAEPKPEARVRNKPRVRKAPDPVVVNWRMAYIGTVAFVDGDRETLLTRKYSATAQDGPGEVLHAMMQDVRHALGHKSDLRLIVVQDAAPEMWNLMRGALEAQASVDRYEEVIDHYHAMEHLHAAAASIDEDTALLMAQWKQALRDSDDAIDAIHARILRESTEGYVPKLRIILEDEATYIDNNNDRLRYATLRQGGFPIGSGPTEGACKSLVATRCKRSGQRWRNPGLRAALACRDILLNERLSPVMQTLRRRHYTADVRRAA